MVSRPSGSASSSPSGSSGADQPAARNSPSAASSSSRRRRPRSGYTREDESPAAAASARMDTPSGRADASAQLRSRPACSNRYAARDTRSSTRRSRRHVALRSAIFMHSACPACSVQQSGHAGGVHGVVLTCTPTPNRRASGPRYSAHIASLPSMRGLRVIDFQDAQVVDQRCGQVRHPITTRAAERYLPGPLSILRRISSLKRSHTRPVLLRSTLRVIQNCL